MAKRKRRTPGKWRITYRKIKGVRRKARVRSLPHGKEQIQILDSKPRRTKAEKLRGIALAEHINAQRSTPAKRTDKRLRAKHKVRPTQEGIKEWKKHPGQMDIKHVDTPN